MRRCTGLSLSSSSNTNKWIYAWVYHSMYEFSLVNIICLEQQIFLCFFFLFVCSAVYISSNSKNCWHNTGPECEIWFWNEKISSSALKNCSYSARYRLRLRKILFEIVYALDCYNFDIFATIGSSDSVRWIVCSWAE